jgi:hypothetical protein
MRYLEAPPAVADPVTEHEANDFAYGAAQLAADLEERDDFACGAAQLLVDLDGDLIAASPPLLPVTRPAQSKISKIMGMVRSDAIRKFGQLDQDGNGTLDANELASLAKLLKQIWTKKDVLKYFHRMVSMELLASSRQQEPLACGHGHGSGESDDAEPEVRLETFIRWWMGYQTDVRRKLVREACALFEEELGRQGDMGDVRGLDRDRFNAIVVKVLRTSHNYKSLPSGTIDPPFSSSATFETVPKDRANTVRARPGRLSALSVP